MNNLPVVRSPWRIAILTVGFTFLYAPMLMLVIYSFNSSKLVTVWAGWSTRWYSELFNDSAMISAVGLSLTIAAAAAATAAVVLGAIAAVVMVRFGRFRGSTGFAFMLTAPLVMPDVITGLSLLLLFVAMGHAFGWPSERGMFMVRKLNRPLLSFLTMNSVKEEPHMVSRKNLIWCGLSQSNAGKCKFCRVFKLKPIFQAHLSREGV